MKPPLPLQRQSMFCHKRLVCFKIISRYEHGIRKPEEFKSLGKRSRLQQKKIAEGELKGAFIYLAYSQELNQITPKPLPQVGFQSKTSSDYTYFLLDDIPDKTELENQGLDYEINVRAFGDNFEAIEQALAEKGSFPEFQKEIPSNSFLYPKWRARK